MLLPLNNWIFAKKILFWPLNQQCCFFINFKVSQKAQVKNLIAISSYKTNNFLSIYGITKFIMGGNLMLNNYSVYKGVNFFWSDQSVLDIWHKKVQQEKS